MFNSTKEEDKIGIGLTVGTVGFSYNLIRNIHFQMVAIQS